MQTLNCKKCHAEIDAENINLDRLIAKCDRCNTVFSFADEFPEAQRGAALQRRSVVAPKHLQIKDKGYALEIKWRWFQWTTLFLAFFTVFWNGFMLVWFSIAFTQQAWTMAAFGTLHGIVGVTLLYFTVASFLNTSYLQVDNKALSIIHRPLYYPPTHIAVHELEQLYCKEHMHRNKNSTSYTYSLNALTRNSKKRYCTLLSNIQAPEQALFLEQEIERFLQIKDVPVAGDYR